MRRIGIDLGTKTGWAIQDGTFITSGLENFAPKRFESSAMRPLRFRDWLTSLIVPGQTMIAFEEVRNHKGVDAAHCYGGLLAVLLMVCEENGVPCQGHPVGAIKKHATGKGNANKQAMIDAANRKWPDQNVTDDNQADALWILDYDTRLETGI